MGGPGSPARPLCRRAVSLPRRKRQRTLSPEQVVTQAGLRAAVRYPPRKGAPGARGGVPGRQQHLRMATPTPHVWRGTSRGRSRPRTTGRRWGTPRPPRRDGLRTVSGTEPKRAPGPGNSREIPEPGPLSPTGRRLLREKPVPAASDTPRRPRGLRRRPQISLYSDGRTGCRMGLHVLAAGRTSSLNTSRSVTASGITSVTGVSLLNPSYTVVPDPVDARDRCWWVMSGQHRRGRPWPCWVGTGLCVGEGCGAVCDGGDDADGGRDEVGLDAAVAGPVRDPGEDLVGLGALVGGRFAVEPCMQLSRK